MSSESDSRRSGYGGDRSRGSRGGGASSSALSSARKPAKTNEEIQEEKKRIRTKKIDKCKEYMADNNIQPGSTVLDTKIAPGTIGRAEKKLTNICGVKLKSTVAYLYDVKVLGRTIGPRPKLVEFTKRAKNEPKTIDNKEICRIIFNDFRDNYLVNENFKEGCVLYDLQSQLYIVGAEMRKSSFIWPVNDFRNLNLSESDVPKFSQYSNMEMQIKSTGKAIPLDDLNHFVSNDVAKIDRSHAVFIGVATNQVALFDPYNYIVMNGGKIYAFRNEALLTNQDALERLERCSDGTHCVSMGYKKASMYVEGIKGRGHTNTAIVVDPIATSFYASTSNVLKFLYRVKNIRLDPPDVHELMRAIRPLLGIEVYNILQYQKTYKKRPFRAMRLSRFTAREHTFKDKSGRVMNELEYYWLNYHHELRFPDLPMLQGPKPMDLVPLEVAAIIDHQAVPTGSLSPREIEAFMKAAAQLPADQNSTTDNAVKYIRTTVDKVAGLSITRRLETNARVLPAPIVIQGEEKTSVPDQFGVWRATKFFRGGKSNGFGIIRVSNAGRGLTAASVDREFGQRFAFFARQRGIEFPEAPIFDKLVHSINDMENELKDVAAEKHESGLDFILVITDAIIKNQEALKYTERDIQIVTQNMLPLQAMAFINKKSATMDNILAKTNIKLGGLNYSFVQNEIIAESFGTRPLIIGLSLSQSMTHAIDTSVDDSIDGDNVSVASGDSRRGGASSSRGRQHSGPSSSSSQQGDSSRGFVKQNFSFIGYVANHKADLHDFVGDFLPNARNRQEVVEYIPHLMKEIFNRYHNHNETNPTSVVLYLNGSSDGDFPLLLEIVIPMAKRALEEKYGTEMKFVVINPQRHHRIRFFNEDINRRDEPREQNIRPGTVIDEGATHPFYDEFYLNSHTAIVGTARTTRYVVLFDNQKPKTLDPYEVLTYHLAFGYQITPSPTALPAPVVMASDMARRGTNIGRTKGAADCIEMLQYNYANIEAFADRRINA